MAGRAAQSSLPDASPPGFGGDPETLFTYGLKSESYGEKEKGQTDNFTDFSNLAPRNNEILNLWLDFQKVARFIDDNKEWLMPLLERIKEKK